VEETGPGAARLRYRMLSLADPPAAVPVRLVQEGPGETLVLGRWDLTGDRDGTFTATGLRPGNRYRFRLEFPFGATPDREVVLETAEPAHLLAPGSISRWGGAWVEYRLPEPGSVSLDVFAVSGRRVARWVHGERAAGWHRLPWPGRTGSGRAMAPGVYFLRLAAPGVEETRRVVLLP
jgi:hypothetical protein